MPPKDESEMIRVRIGNPLKSEWKKTLEARGISQQRALIAAMRFIIRQEAITQAMIFEQVPDTDHAELSAIVLKRLSAKKRKG